MAKSSRFTWFLIVMVVISVIGLGLGGLAYFMNPLRGSAGVLPAESIERLKGWGSQSVNFPPGTFDVIPYSEALIDDVRLLADLETKHAKEIDSLISSYYPDETLGRPRIFDDPDAVIVLADLDQVRPVIDAYLSVLAHDEFVIEAYCSASPFATPGFTVILNEFYPFGVAYLRDVSHLSLILAIAHLNAGDYERAVEIVNLVSKNAILSESTPWPTRIQSYAIRERLGYFLNYLLRLDPSEELLRSTLRTMQSFRHHTVIMQFPPYMPEIGATYADFEIFRELRRRGEDVRPQHLTLRQLTALGQRTYAQYLEEVLVDRTFSPELEDSIKRSVTDAREKADLFSYEYGEKRALIRDWKHWRAEIGASVNLMIETDANRAYESDTDFVIRDRLLISKEDLRRIEVARRLYALENAKEAESLAQLVPDFLNEIPIDPFSVDGAPYIKGHTYYSVGPDGSDDGGGLLFDPTINGFDTLGDIYLDFSWPLEPQPKQRSL